MRPLLIALLLKLTFIQSMYPQLRELKPGWNVFSPSDDVEIGRKSAAEIENTRAIVRNEEVNAYLARIAARLARSRHAGDFAFHIQVINDKAVNAFGFPGGPIFIDTGTLAAIDSETELAGVLAHEMSHIALRHGTHQASKAILIQAPAAFAGAMIDDDSKMSKLAKLGIDFTAHSLLLKYSREAESEADLNGAQIMNDARYDPAGMTRFFEKLQTQGTQPGGRLSVFLSDHPSPPHRTRAVENEISQMPARDYRESEPRTLTRIKKILAALPAAKPAAHTTDGASF